MTDTTVDDWNAPLNEIRGPDGEAVNEDEPDKPVDDWGEGFPVEEPLGKE